MPVGLGLGIAVHSGVSYYRITSLAFELTRRNATTSIIVWTAPYLSLATRQSRPHGSTGRSHSGTGCSRCRSRPCSKTAA